MGLLRLYGPSLRISWGARRRISRKPGRRGRLVVRARGREMRKKAIPRPVNEVFGALLG